MNAVAIIVGDNDFGNTFYNLLQTVKRVVEHNPEVSEEALTKIIKEGVRFHYIAFQNQYGLIYGKESTLFNEHFTHIENYLNSHIKILFDERANYALMEEDHDHGAWYIHLESGQMYSF